MNNDPFAQAYVSTSQAAKILGLSVGTVQRMVETGVFKAFVTQGGHRRILSSSLNQFCEAQGFASPQMALAPSLICILHANDKVNAALAQLSPWRNVKIITQPLDLMGLQQPMGALFIDARIAWVHGSPVHLQDTAARDAHIVIYNSAQLPPASALHAANRVSLFEGDISTDLVFGYLLGSTRGPGPNGPRIGQPAIPRNPQLGTPRPTHRPAALPQRAASAQKHTAS
jgi:excisionase family DNA binding protein